jgi:hypothetical protein
MAGDSQSWDRTYRRGFLAPNESTTSNEPAETPTGCAPGPETRTRHAFEAGPATVQASALSVAVAVPRTCHVLPASRDSSTVTLPAMTLARQPTYWVVPTLNRSPGAGDVTSIVAISVATKLLVTELPETPIWRGDPCTARPGAETVTV